MHVGALHPQIYGYAWNWEFGDDFCDEVKVDGAVLQTDAYRKNPLYRVVEYGELIRGRADDADQLPGIADWRPLRSGIGLHRGEVFFGNVGAPGKRKTPLRRGRAGRGFL